jgi:hypothetical protein
MVRRWSYINEINRTVFIENSAIPRARHEMTVRVNLYYKKKFSSISLLRRRSWIKRRHINTFAIYRNILADWSGDYIFYRKYAKFRFFYQLFRDSFWAQNFISIRNLIPSHYRDFEKVYTTTFIKTVFNYCTVRGSNRFKYLGNFSHTLWLHVTSPKLADIFKAQTTNTYTLTYRVANNQLVHPKLKPKSPFLYQQLVNTLHVLYTAKLIELYKVATLLALVNIF